MRAVRKAVDTDVRQTIMSRFGRDRGKLLHLPVLNPEIRDGENFLKFLESSSQVTRNVFSCSGPRGIPLEIITVRTSLENSGIYREIIDAAIGALFPQIGVTAILANGGQDDLELTWLATFKLYPTMQDLRAAGIETFNVNEASDGISITLFFAIDTMNDTISFTDVKTAGAAALNKTKPTERINALGDILCCPPSLRRLGVCSIDTRSTKFTSGTNRRLGVIELVVKKNDNSPKDILGNLPVLRSYELPANMPRCYIRSNMTAVAGAIAKNSRKDTTVTRVGDALVRVKKERVANDGDFQCEPAPDDNLATARPAPIFGEFVCELPEDVSERQLVGQFVCEPPEDVSEAGISAENPAMIFNLEPEDEDKPVQTTADYAAFSMEDEDEPKQKSKMAVSDHAVPFSMEPEDEPEQKFKFAAVANAFAFVPDEESFDY